MNNKIIMLSFVVLGLILTALFARRGANAAPSTPLQQTNREEELDVSEITDTAFRRIVEEYEAYVEEALVKENVPGAAVAIVKDGKIAYLRGFGLKQTGTRDSIDVHTVFRLASLSKGFAPVLTGLMVQDGVLEWDDPVVRHVPDFRLRDKKSTEMLNLRHILSHTTGLPRHAYSNLLNDGLDYEQIVHKLKDVKLPYKVGKHHDYQNVAYSLIGDVIANSTGRSYNELLVERLFKPAGMKDASAGYDEIMASSNVALPHGVSKNGYYPMDISPRYYSASPAAGVNASIYDMAQWLRLLLGHRQEVIKPATLHEIFTPQVTMPLRESTLYQWRPLERAWYALGWRVMERSDTQRLIYHGGFVNGYRGEVAFSPEDQIGIVVLSNSVSNFISESAPRFFDLYWYLYPSLEPENALPQLSIR
ncbi:MAG: serine hydrolase domain-containing protein [Saprospiraceae bacterium]|nr:serine hydrolase domain-containing protein [Saprospiraceae bacterium]MDZ4703176.1 serine hydrolase domain-containing protein [Saprospiraceae bacterium]